MKRPIQPVLMVDAVDRMHYDSLFSLTPGMNRVVYLEKVEVDNYTIGQIDELRDLVYERMDQGLRRYRKYPKS